MSKNNRTLAQRIANILNQDSFNESDLANIIVNDLGVDHLWFCSYCDKWVDIYKHKDCNVTATAGTN